MKIKELRKQKGMTQQELADALELAKVTIASWEQGAREPKLDSLMTMADVFGVTVDDLLEHTPKVDQYTLNEEAIITEFQRLTIEQQKQVIEYARFIQKK